MLDSTRPNPSLVGRIANDLTFAVAVLEAFRQHPGLPDELCEMAETALTRLLRVGEQISRFSPLLSR